MQVNYVDWNRRLWDWNRTEFTPERLLTSFDGAPINVCGSSNKWIRRLTKSAKYQTYVVKFDVGIALYGAPVDFGALRLGVRNDARPTLLTTAGCWLAAAGCCSSPALPLHRMWKDHVRRRRRMFPWEYAAGALLA